MTPQEFNEWEQSFFESLPVMYFLNGDTVDLKEKPLPRWPRLKAPDKNFLHSCGIKG